MFFSKGKFFWKNKKVFVTGHTGFKGAWLCLMLKQLGAKITGYSLPPDGSNIIFSESGIHKNIKNYYADIRERKKLNYAIYNSKPDILIHMAAQPIVLESFVQPYETFDTNFIGTLNILEEIKKNSIKSSVIITTDKVYRNRERDIMFREYDELGGEDPYSASKAAVEILVNSYNSSFFKNKLMVATARAGNVIGGGDRAIKRIIPDFFRAKDSNNKLNIRSPDSIRPWQFVLEPLAGYLLIAEANYFKKISNSVDQAWNFAPLEKHKISVKDLISEINKYFNVKLSFHSKSSKLEKKILALSSVKAKKYLNWKCHYSIKKVIKEIVEWELAYINHKSIGLFSNFQVTNYLKILGWK